METVLDSFFKKGAEKLAEQAVEGMNKPNGNAGQNSAGVVPHGLRSFDESCSSFFPSLLPPPHMKDGTPEIVHFWQQFVEMDAEHRFGVIWGPTGSGKSSLARAGIVAKLKKFTHLRIECRADDTPEERFLSEFKVRFPAVQRFRTAATAMERVVTGDSAQPLVVLLDQLEQWLNSHSTESLLPLFRAFADISPSVELKILIVIRDDYLTPLEKIFGRIGIELRENRNKRCVHLFDEAHAVDVLKLFADGYGKANEKTSLNHFCENAVSQLSVNGEVVPLKLALFGEMMQRQGQPWTVASLWSLGGVQGIVVRYLNSAFIDSTAPSEQRKHCQSAQNLLRCFLVDSYEEHIEQKIRSKYCRVAELSSAFAGSGADFKSTMTLLLDLRLISRVGASEEDNGTQSFQLTHDYLLEPLRIWLSKAETSSKSGRAHQRLRQLSRDWHNSGQKQYPSSREYIWLRPQLKKNGLRASDRTFVSHCDLRVAMRSVIIVLSSAAIILGISMLSLARSYSVLRNNLEVADIDLLEERERELRTHPFWPTSKIFEFLYPSTLTRIQSASERSDKVARRNLEIVYVSAYRKDILFDLTDYSLRASPAELRQIIRQFKCVQPDLDRLWAELLRSSDDGIKLRAGAILANLAIKDVRWQRSTDTIARLLSQLPVQTSTEWLPFFEELKPRLTVSLRSLTSSQSVLALRAASLFALVADFDETRAFLETANLEQFVIVSDQILQRGYKSRGTVERLAELVRNDQTQMEAGNIALLLLKAGQGEPVWRLFRDMENPTLVNYITTNAYTAGVSGELISQRLLSKDMLAQERPWLVSALVSYPATEVLNETRAECELLLRLWLAGDDQGLSAKAALLLNRWKLPSSDGSSKRVGCTPDGQKLVEILPELCKVGSPLAEHGRDEDESISEVSPLVPFLIADAEVTVAMFETRLGSAGLTARDREKYAPTPDCPMVGANWFDAVRYCQSLNVEEGIPEDQWCYIPLNEQKTKWRVPADFLTRTGYRLPTEMEWEIACRARTTSSWCSGSRDDLLGAFSWFTANSKYQTQPIKGLRPNSFGLFDMHGNAWEWCHDAKADYAASRSLTEEIVDSDSKRILRGGCFMDPPSLLRSANRWELSTKQYFYYTGFRVARTRPQ